MNNAPSFAPGFTVRSVAASILSIVLTGAFMQYAGVADLWGANLGSEGLAVPAMMVFLVLALVSAGLYAARRWRLLSRPEMLCVLYATLIASPLMGHGYWRTMLGGTSAIARAALFDKLDALSPKLWPHGGNLINGVLARPDDPSLSFSERVTWRSAEVGDNEQRTIPMLSNDLAEQVSWLRLSLKADSLPRRMPFMLAVLARARDLGPQAQYYCRIYYDSSADFAEEAFTSRQTEERTYLQKQGFVRLGKYGVSFPASVRRQVSIEFGLAGKGTVEFDDAQLVDVSAVELAYPGRQVIGEEEFGRLPPEERAGLSVRPRHMWSLRGVAFLLVGLFPAREWLTPTAAWGTYMLLVMAALFAVAVIMRRQWIQNERYPLPLAQVPFALLGDETDEGRAFPAVWRNRFMWAGFAIAFLWCLVRLAHAFNTSVPNMSISVALKPYFTDVRWGRTWDDVTFTVSALFLGLSLFMEQNVLISMVVGFFLYRFQFWFGEARGLATMQDFPFAAQQLMGAYTAYAVLVLVFTRKYLWRVLKMAVRGERDGQEALSYRTAILVLVGGFVGVIVWSRWVGLPVAGMLAFYAYLLSLGFVACKLRAECGAPNANYAGPQNPGPSSSLLAIIPALGGMAFFSPGGIIFVCLFAAIFGYLFCFLNVSGLQLELIEAGRRLRLRPSHLPLTALLGIVAGIVIGGWFYLSGLYSLGADNYPLKAAYFEKGGGEFNDYNVALARVSDAAAGAVEQDAAEARPGAGRLEARTLALVFSAALTGVLTVLRQLFAGFWFHPMGFILGSTGMVNGLWGSLLLAFLIRFTVLRLGGAATVREKLLPFATGVFLASIAAYIVCMFVNGYVWFFNQGGVEFGRDFF